LNHIFDQTVGNPRAITELINRYRKEPFGHANDKGDSAFGRIARNRHDLDCNCFTWFAHFAAFVARNGRTRLAFIGSMAMILLFLTPDDGELQEKICLNFVQNWTQNKTSHYLYFVGCAPF
jgi:hypothetical protein